MFSEKVLLGQKEFRKHRVKENESSLKISQIFQFTNGKYDSLKKGYKI
jgi:hypothetical protein